jgi:hypothetical protein
MDVGAGVKIAGPADTLMLNAVRLAHVIAVYRMIERQLHEADKGNGSVSGYF